MIRVRSAAVLVVSLLLALGVARTAEAQQGVQLSTPLMNASTAHEGIKITVEFIHRLDPNTAPPVTTANVYVFGSATGSAKGSWFLANSNRLLQFTPERPFAAGETVTVGFTRDLLTSDGASFAGYAYQYLVRAAPGPRVFTATSVLSARTNPNVQVTLYGANGCDFNGDDYIDLAAINEGSSDVRVFLNKADATGAFHPFLTPVNPVGGVPSPNAAGDFDRDGKTDLITCNTNGSGVTVLLGNGDGTFDPGVTYAMGGAPHGIAVFDANGDGAWDVATANTGTNNVALRLNNGNGTFAPATFFEGGGNGEYSITAAEMNNDGLLDLVVGSISSQTLCVHLSNGDGTFSAQPPKPAGGQTWMIRAWDVNGDRNLDIASANSFSNNGSILLGDGTGVLGAPQVLAANSDPVATDLGDIDGDGDIDWVLSCFASGLWIVYTNNGSGIFSFDQQLSATSNASCAMLIDVDMDRDLDLVGSDETSDELTIFENGSSIAHTFCYGTASACPCANPGLSAHGCEHSFQFGGGLLSSQGEARVSNDTLSLVASGLPSTTITLFFQGTTQVNGGLGVFNGDGITCAGGTLIRLGTDPTANYGAGMSALGFVHAHTPLHVTGVIPAGGATRVYQGYYRNDVPYCTSGTYNLTNALELTWVP